MKNLFKGMDINYWMESVVDNQTGFIAPRYMVQLDGCELSDFYKFREEVYTEEPRT